ncbi:MAG: hypothetical protein AAB596_01465 [Patescibacteria group bacterium]
MNFLKIIIFLIIAVGLAIYFLGQTPTLFSDLKGKRFTPISSVSGPAAKYTEPQSITPQTPQVPFAPVVYLPEVPDYRIPAGFKREQLSPYFDKIRISSANYSSNAAYPSEIRLYSYLSSSNKGDFINISGWKIRNNYSEVIIPQAVDIYEPSGVVPEKDIILSAENNGSYYIILYSNKSALGRNIRLNKCIGYLENSYSFNPALSKNCPSIPRQDISNLSGECQNYIYSLGSCGAVNTSFYNTLSGTSDGNACRQFLNTIGTYGSCFSKYRYEKDFLSNEYRLWINQDLGIDQFHDRLRLFDRSGLLVSEYIY